MIMDLLIFDVETKEKTTITVNRVIVLLYLTHLFVYVLLFGKVFFFGGGGGNNAVFFYWHMFNKDQ